MTWQLATIISIVFFSLANALQKIIGVKVHPLYFIPTFGLGILVSSLVLLLIPKLFGWNNLPFTTSSIVPLTIAGILWTAGQIFFFITITGKAPFSTVMTVFTVSAAIFSYLVGVFFFRDAIKPLNLFGLLVALVGLGFLSL